MLNDDQKRQILEYWYLADNDLPAPSDERDWALVEFGMWFAKIPAPRANSSEVDRERVMLLLARRKRNTSQSISKAYGELYGSIHYVSGPNVGKIIEYETLKSWATRTPLGKTKAHRKEDPLNTTATPQQIIDSDTIFEILPAFSTLDQSISTWEVLNGMPINTGLPKGW
jgi:hypothetical protein